MSIDYKGFVNIEDMIAALKAHDEEAWTMLFESHNGSLVRVVNSRVAHLDRAATDDIVQDVWIKAYEKIGTFTLFSEEKGIVPWLFGISRFCCLRYFNQVSHTAEVSLEDIDEDLTTIRLLALESHDDAFSKILLDSFMDEIAKLLDEVPEQQKAVFLLRVLYDMPYKEIAERGEVSEQNAAKIYERIRKFLKNRSEPLDFE